MVSFIVFWEVMLRGCGIFHCACGLFHCVLGGYVERGCGIFIVFWEVMLREVVVSFIVFWEVMF